MDLLSKLLCKQLSIKHLMKFKEEENNAENIDESFNYEEENNDDTWSMSQCAQLYQASGGVKGTMYGMLLESIQHFIATKHGDDKWNLILEKAGAKNTLFTTHRRYKDSLMVQLAEICASVLQDGDRFYYMHFFGTCFVQFFTHYGYDKILRVSGRYYRDFLHGIDNLHETMRFSFPKMLSPSFYVGDEDANGCILHYHSKRYGFTHYVIGQLQQCARMFYSEEVEVLVMAEEYNEKGLHVIYRLNFDNSAYTPFSLRSVSPAVQQYPSITGKTFFKVFPFCLVFNEKMIITRVGKTIAELFKRNNLVDQNIVRCFTLRRPLVEFTWQNVVTLQNVIFELRSSFAINQKCSLAEGTPCDCCNHRGRKRALLLKGQMRYMDDFEGIAFLCNPLINSLEDLRETGLYINDLNMYDSSRHIVIAGYQHASSLEFSIEKQMEKTQQIADNLRRLDEWRQKSENLLYSMIPKTIADRLKRGEDPISTCESFEEVTVMFSYLIGFSETCAKMTAQQLVENINSIFTCFDSIVDAHQVLKVETVGDAVYMVAGGVPQRTNRHAQNVAAVALELRDAVKNKFINLKIRIGLHTGSVVAGVVGMKMPQYCLFGDTVNTASRMQTFGQGDRIHLSESCEKCLQGTEYVTIFRGRVLIKGKGYMNTYWLAGRRGDMETLRAYKELRQETRQLLSLEGVSTLSNSVTDDDGAMVEFPRRKKSDASIYEDLVRQQNKIQSGRGHRLSVPNILTNIQPNFCRLEERSESSISSTSLSTAADTMTSPDTSKVTWLGLTSASESLTRSPSYDDDYLSDDSDSSYKMLHDDPASHDSTFGPFQPWMPRGIHLRRPSSTESYEEVEEDEDRNSLSDTEFLIVRRLSCIVTPSKIMKKSNQANRRHTHDIVDGMRRNIHSERELTTYDLRAYQRQREITKVSESEEHEFHFPIRSRLTNLNGYLDSSSDDEPTMRRTSVESRKALNARTTFSQGQYVSSCPSKVRSDDSDKDGAKTRSHSPLTDNSERSSASPLVSDSETDSPRLSVKCLREIFEKNADQIPPKPACPFNFTKATKPSILKSQDVAKPSMCPFAFASEKSSAKTNSKPSTKVTFGPECVHVPVTNKQTGKGNMARPVLLPLKVNKTNSIMKSSSTNEPYNCNPEKCTETNTNEILPSTSNADETPTNTTFQRNTDNEICLDTNDCDSHSNVCDANQSSV